MTKVQKTAEILYKVTIKSNGIQVYIAQASNGIDTYNVTVTSGNRVSSCSCPATRKCYHMATVEAKIAESQAKLDEQAPKEEIEDDPFVHSGNAVKATLPTHLKGHLNGSTQGFSLLR